VLYLRMGARPMFCLRKVKHVGLAQDSSSQPSRSWMIYLGYELVTAGRQGDGESNGRHLLLYDRLEVVTATGFVYDMYSLGVVDVLDQVSQLVGRIAWQSGEARLLPEADQDVQVTAPVAGMAAVKRPGRIGSHYMESCERRPYMRNAGSTRGGASSRCRCLGIDGSRQMTSRSRGSGRERGAEAGCGWARGVVGQLSRY
jgi:hypothetical protein